MKLESKEKLDFREILVTKVCRVILDLEARRVILVLLVLLVLKVLQAFMVLLALKVI